MQIVFYGSWFLYHRIINSSQNNKRGITVLQLLTIIINIARVTYNCTSIPLNLYCHNKL